MNDMIKGGGFLITKTQPDMIFTPEDFTIEHKLISETTSGFVERRVMPQMDVLEAKNEGLTKELVLELGELGLLAADIPEQYGGIETDKISSLIIAEELGKTGSFAIAQGCQVGIGSLPIVYFGNEQQKRKYLPDIASGNKLAAYALTEAGAGSDALAISAKAKLSPDGKFYILNGTKQFISNAGYSDIFIVFAKVDGDKFSAFIVDRGSEGFSIGREEKKMGLKGSSTCALILEDVKVPVENLLFEIGRGHVVAFNILNMGRLKAPASCLGAAKYALELSAIYANERRQFKAPIAEFGMIKEKIANMAVGIYVAETMLYRTCGHIDEAMRLLDTGGPDSGRMIAKAIEEYAIECSINKVFSTEALAYIVDEGVQIHGGYGYIHEYPIERLYRDARIFRIFEGTNEINRTLIPTILMRRGVKSTLPLNEAVATLKNVMKNGLPDRLTPEDLVQAAKDIFIFTLSVSIEKYGESLTREQEILGRISDIAILAFAMESAWLRAEKVVQKTGGKIAHLKMKMGRAFIYDTIDKIRQAASQVIAAVENGNELRRLREDLSELMKYTPIDGIALKREIASAIFETGKYVV